jgi:antitoxin (DNA-binding transcriptional repressor) of toxin-antitoxin stability system
MTPRTGPTRPDRRAGGGKGGQDVRKTAYTMRELGKLTAEQVRQIDRPVPVTSNGQPVAWLVPLTQSESRRAQMIADGRLEPRRREDLEAWSPQPAAEPGEPTLSEILRALREHDRT